MSVSVSKKTSQLENCWRQSHATRGAFIIEAADYYRFFRKAVLNAQKQVQMLAWDLMEDVRLIRDEAAEDGYPAELADFLYKVVEEKPDLEIRILLWDYSMLYVAEREWLPLSRWRKQPHPRIIVKEDSKISMGASHHQKLVVVDGDFAFCGGLDFSAWRWDTQEHLLHDPRRTDPKNEPYQPYHDVQMAISGDVALELGELFRMRWERATGEALAASECRRAEAVWPEELDVDFEDVPVGIALTFSEYKTYQAARHIEQVYLDFIGSAERYIYIENQFLSTHHLTQALINRLKEADGPEVVIILTKDTGGWIEEGTLGLLRDRLVEMLYEADEHARVRVYYPRVQNEDGESGQVYVHAKLMICDDRRVVVGSANLSNRSMKVDSEVDLVIAQQEIYQPVRQFLRRLLAVHFQASVEAVDAELDAAGSIHAAIESLRKDRLHTLEAINYKSSGLIRRKLADSQWLDPDEPIDPGHWLRKVFAGKRGKPSQVLNWGTYVKFGTWILGGVLLVYLLNQAWLAVIDPDQVSEYLKVLRGSAIMLPILFGIFVLAGVLAVPINVLLVAATITIGPWAAFGCGFLGSLLSAFIAFAFGQYGGQPIVEKLFDHKIDELSEQIGRRGILSVALIRVLPIAPFVVINLVAGISKLSFRTFAIGSILGMLPGMLGVVLVTHQARNTFINPTWETAAWLFGVVLLCVGGIYLVKKSAK